jgi:hypothetical protein
MEISVMRTLIFVPTLLMFLFVTSACGNKGDKASTSSGPTLPANLVATSIDGSPQTVIETLKDKKAGDTALVVGLIGGKMEPFAKNRAVFQLIDASMKPCDLTNGGCPAPWDYCCEPPEQILASSMTVQVVGADGRPLPLGLEGKDGLEPLTTLVVSGKVNQASDGVFVLDADKIMIAKASPVSHAGHDHD